MHLRSGVEVCLSQGKVAFGSCSQDVFRKLDDERDGAPVNVFIYASGDPTAKQLEASWCGRYIQHVDSKDGSHPAGMKFRPTSTEKHPSDNEGHWTLFWEIDQLHELKPSERIPITSFVGYPSGKGFKEHFVPKGPLLVASPQTSPA